MRRDLLVVLLACIVLAGCARLGGEAFQPTTSGVLPLAPDTTLGQTFRPAGDRVAGVDVLVATFAAPVDPAGTLTIDVRSSAGDVLAQTEIEAAELADNAWVQARFAEPVAPGDVLALTVGWDGDSLLGLYANTPSGRCGGDSEPLCNDPYPGGELLLDGEPAAGDLAFRVVGGTGVLSAAAALVRTGAARLDDAVLFLVFWPLAVLGCAALAVLGFRRAD